MSGSGTNLQTLIEKLHQDKTSGIEIAVVISDRQKAYALTRAQRASIPTHIVKTQDFENRVDFDAEISRCIEHYTAEPRRPRGIYETVPTAFRPKIPKPDYQCPSHTFASISGRTPCPLIR